MPGVIGDLRGQRFGRLKVPDGADPVIHNHNAYRPVIYDAARWAWSLDSNSRGQPSSNGPRGAGRSRGWGDRHQELRVPPCYQRRVWPNSS